MVAFFASSHLLFELGSEVQKRPEHTNATTLKNKTKEKEKKKSFGA